MGDSRDDARINVTVAPAYINQQEAGNRSRPRLCRRQSMEQRRSGSVRIFRGRRGRDDDWAGFVGGLEVAAFAFCAHSSTRCEILIIQSCKYDITLV